MKTYLIQRNLPHAADLTMAEIKTIAQRSCAVIEDLGNESIQWLHSYITGNHLWCVYRADEEQILRDHAARGPFPLELIREIHGTFSPSAAYITLEPAA